MPWRRRAIVPNNSNRRRAKYRRLSLRSVTHAREFLSGIQLLLIHRVHPYHRTFGAIPVSPGVVLFFFLSPVEFLEFFLLLNLSVVDGVRRRHGGGTAGRDVLARICGRDKRVPDVIKLPGEEPGSFGSRNFSTKKKNQSGSDVPRLRGKLVGRTSFATKFVFRREKLAHLSTSRVPAPSLRKITLIACK